MISHLRHLSPPGLRMQLTLWYTIVSVLLMLVFCLAFYSTLQQILFNSFDSTLQQRAQHVAEGVGVDNGKLYVDDMSQEIPELDAPAALIDPYNSYPGPPPPPPPPPPDPGSGSSEPADDLQSSHHELVLVRVLDQAGHEIYSSGAAGDLILPEASVSQPLAGKPWRETINDVDGQSIRVYSTMLVDGDTIIGVVQVGQSLETLNSSLDRIVLVLFLLMLLSLAMCSMGSYWLSGRAFRSIQRLARTAREINANDLNQRVLVPAARDEVRDLSIIFNQMIARLERAFVQQRRLVADASHELRTPVAVIRNMTEVALSQCINTDEYKHVLTEVNEESEHLGHLINDLLILARADEGQIHLDCEPVRLDLLARDVVDSLEVLAQERQMTLYTQTLMPATVLGDAARLIQVIMSLVDNALNYSNSGGVITLSVEVHDSHAYLHVTDTGIGIEAKDIEHIFERFYRADPARSKSVSGTGLGLSIVEWVIHSHKGAIEVRSTPGYGSTFTIILPSANPK